MSAAPDVAVVGAGIVGTAVARELAVRGVRVTIVDRARGVSAGTTGRGEGNVLCSDKDAGPELELTRLGLELYDEIDARLGDEARIRRKGALIVHPDAATWAAEPARLERLRAAGVAGELLTPERVRELEPALDGPLSGASLFPADIQCDPARIARALAREAEAAGATLRLGCEVSRIVVSGGRVTGLEVGPGGRGVATAPGSVAGGRGAATPSGSVAAGRGAATPSGSVAAGRGAATASGFVPAGAVVLAAGPWSAALAAGAGLELPLEPRKGQLVRLRRPGQGHLLRHKVVDGSYLLSVASADAGLQVSTVVETTWDGDVLVGSSRERRGFDLTVDPAVSFAMVERASRLASVLSGLERADAWAGLRPWLPDHLPAIGESHVGGLWVATGHEGAGVACGPVTGRVLAQAFCGERPLLDLAPFDPSRFAAG